MPAARVRDPRRAETSTAHRTIKEPSGESPLCGGVTAGLAECGSILRVARRRAFDGAFQRFLVPASIGELSFAVWLTVKGVNVARWQEKAEHSTASL